MLADASPMNVPEEYRVHRVGQWMPKDHRVHKEWLDGIIDHVYNEPRELVPVLKEFKHMIENNTRIFLLFSEMFSQIPKKKPYINDPTGHHQIRDHDHMLKVLNYILTTAPSWNDKSHRVGLVGLPINAIFDWPMGTTSGFAVFLDPDVNQMLKKVLDVWGQFLTSEESAYVLDNADYGWFGEDGVKSLTSVGNAGESSHRFEDMFDCDPSKPRFGFKSWDEFFTRTFREGIRPVASPEDDNIIANCCESLPFKVASDVRFRDKFWLKGQPYSLYDMLAQDELAEQFVGGTVYQAFLSALSYHRWHSPVSGKVVKSYTVQGTYFSEPMFEDFTENKGASMEGETISQGYLTAVATRSIIFIEADNPAIGLMCFLGIGMAEVSTCDTTVRQGQHLKKGDQLGMFHFGGSTHCLLFGKGVQVEGFPSPGQRKHNVPVRSKLAVVQV
ncbi:phosphatidylserine decarboxylase [Exophiala aquamarina CBS 119918]|uniref:Phosphatidylserine decarboxylase n=1 Tax=Exophiala aquamarina CBS 119918 TaxID=1182545 RepID=A0A072P5M5_9EURO|nr:phosphatidylserine decarboxylase [Exophiala aquamarina CBS 119918]KEF55151.1 phosphatidylserine decarboxylase [Exophiala aquamarina CBS 119918]